MENSAEKLNTLQQLLKESDHTRDDTQALQDQLEILKYIDANILQDEYLKKHLTLLEAVVYAIRCILQPRLDVDAIPDLLDLLTTVEFYRAKITKVVNTAFEWNKFYEDSHGALTLNPDQIRELNKVTARDKTQRGLYILLCCVLSKRHLYHLLSKKPPSGVDFLIHFNDYYPGLLSSMPSRRLFHTDLSAKEKAEIDRSGRECSNILYTIVGSTSSLLEEIERYDEMATPHEIQPIANRYLKHVEESIALLRTYFSPQGPGSR
ncbi:hypothetical protein AX16_004030 [Volvariella volvacea WC 439]|nr:hypothetical protein AX16_004030 [Volvariella volvacea WC 439]